MHYLYRKRKVTKAQKNAEVVITIMIFMGVLQGKGKTFVLKISTTNEFF
jgi:hypothetical protein